MPLMSLRPVLGNSRGMIGQMTARVAGHAHTTAEDLDGRGSGAHLDLLLGELIRHAVPVVVEVHVVVDVDATGFPIAVLIALCRQGAQDWLIKQFKLAAAGGLAAARWPLL